MKHLKIKITTIIFIVIIMLVGILNASNYNNRYKFLCKSIPEKSLNEMLIKTNRVQLWETFAENTYNLLCEGGNIDDSELFNKSSYTILLISIDEDYRINGKIFYLKRNPLLGIKESNWYSVNELENQIIPDIKSKLIIMENKQSREQFFKIFDKLIWRKETLLNLKFENLWIIPPHLKKSLEWSSISNSKDEGFREIFSELKNSYKEKNAEGFLHNWKLLTTKLKKNRNVEKLWRFEVEKLYNDVPFMTLSFFLYLFASVLMFVNIPIRNNKANKISFLLIISGFVFHTLYLTMRSLIGWHLPVTGMYEYISLLAWAIILLTIIIQITRKLSFLATIIAPIAMILIVISSLFPKEIETQLVPALNSYWLTIHVILASIGEGAFAIAFALAIFYLIKGDRTGGMLPSKIKLEEIAYKSVLVGYPFFTIGALIAGAIWAEQAWGSWWSWDPKETCSLIVWLVATAYLHARITRGWRGKKSIFLVILIFLLSLFTLFSNMIFGGLHSYGTGI